MTNLLDDASLPTDAPALEAELAELEERLQACQNDIRQLMAAEDPARGIWHATSIHEAKQTIMMLRYQREVRATRLRLLRLEKEDRI